MKKVLLLIVLFLLSFSLAAAVDISTSKTDYSGNEMVSVSIGGCVGTSIVQFFNPGGKMVDIKSGEDSWSTSYNTLSDSADGKYSISATCTNGATQKNFCVDAPGCLSSSNLPAPPESPNLPSTSNGGSSCTPDWSCSTWTFCGPTSTQSRSCTDLNHCQSAKDETRACEPCLESWVCSLWAECNAGTQLRACYDEHFCETTNYKPGLEKGCSQADPLPPPARISSQLPPPFTPPSGIVQQSFWDNYKIYIIGGAAAILLAVLTLLAIHYFKPAQVAYNLNELKQWVRQEKKMGTSESDIRQILKQNTGWTEEEIGAAFKSLQSSRA